MPPTNAVVAQIFGVQYLSMLAGFVFLSHQIGSFLGVWLGGKRAVMLMENSGIRVACEELARLGLGQGVPVFMIVPFRGDLGDGQAWAQPHGWTMKPVLEALRADYRVIRHEEEIVPSILAAYATMAASKNHVALIVGKELCDDQPSAAAAR